MPVTPCARALLTAVLLCAAAIFRQPPVQGYWSGELWLAQVAVGAQTGLGLAMVSFSVGYRFATSGTAAATE